ncbi:MAG TPA: glutaredoxin domain-containing protein [Usitatibacter sp.]|nr:glutaredoxin domain-containing protein [Usitatibacter sp.]
MCPRRLLALMLVAALPAVAQVYKWTDSKGRTQYGDKPPDDVKTQELRIPSYDGPVEVRDWAGVLHGKTTAGAGAGVTMYSTSWCGYCKRARDYFTAKGIRFTEIDVEKSTEGNRRFKELGGKGVPLILAGGKVMRGFSVERFEAMQRKR